MEERSVNITIKTLQRRPEATESMTQRAVGVLRREGSGWLLTYREGEGSGLGDTHTVLRLEKGKAALTREGESSSRMVFQPGEPYACRYATPYGEMPMTVKTLALEWELNEAGGEVFIIYKLQLGGADIGENRLRLTVNTKENGYDR